MQQAGTVPGGQRPYRGPYGQPRPRMSFLAMVVIVAVVLVLIVAVTIVAVFAILQPKSPTIVKVKGYQNYEGFWDKPMIYKVLKNESYEPVNQTSSSIIIRFNPYCGDPGTDDANASRALFSSSDIMFEGDNITVKIETRTMSNTEDHRNQLEDATNCAFDRLAGSMKDDLNISLAYQKIDMVKYGTEPGFEAVGVLSVVAVITLVRSRGEQGRRFI